MKLMNCCRCLCVCVCVYLSLLFYYDVGQLFCCYYYKSSYTNDGQTTTRRKPVTYFHLLFSYSKHLPSICYSVLIGTIFLNLHFFFLCDVHSLSMHALEWWRGRRKPCSDSSLWGDKSILVPKTLSLNDFLANIYARVRFYGSPGNLKHFSIA